MPEQTPDQPDVTVTETTTTTERTVEQAEPAPTPVADRLAADAAVQAHPSDHVQRRSNDGPNVYIK